MSRRGVDGRKMHEQIDGVQMDVRFQMIWRLRRSRLDERCRRYSREHIVFDLEKHLPFNGRQVGKRCKIRSEAGTIDEISSKVGINGWKHGNDGHSSVIRVQDRVIVVVVGIIEDGNNAECSVSVGVGDGCAPCTLKLKGVVVLEENDGRVARGGRRNTHGNIDGGKIALVDRSRRSVIILVLMVKMRKEIQPLFP